MERLEVGARDVERAAFVIMSRGKGKVKKTQTCVAALAMFRAPIYRPS